MSQPTLNSIQEIKNYFQKNETNYYFVSATNFNLMVISDWVKQWFNVNFIDCYDEQNNSVIIPESAETPVFNDIEAINQYLLGNKKIVEHIKNHSDSKNPANVCFLFYDPELEKLVKSLGMNLIMPPNKLVKSIDNKITTTEIGNSVDVPSVPNALQKIENYQQLKDCMSANNLGDEVVIQTAYGDSGKTTFFISNEADYQQHADKIEAEETVKIMKRIQCLQVAMEACATKKGTYVGPILTEIIGHPDLTPYKGGWCGNDVNPGMFDDDIQKIMIEYTERFGDALYERGYRGYFEVDYLIDAADRNNLQVYLGELNPRVTGISALTNMSSFCNQVMPLYLFHLLEYSDVNLTLDPTEFNHQVKTFNHSAFGQLIFKYLSDELKIITEIPKTGVYKIENQQLNFIRYADNARNLADDEIYILRIMKQDEYVYKSADILILFANQLLQDEHNKLTRAAETLIATVNQAVKYRELTDEEFQLTQRYGKQASLKTSADDLNE
ncbi:MAG: biotin carboxylase [Methylococcales bacterium]|jgi:biotin carboxylase|nr:biotin carboxylase [Methylococcales bacterium]